MKNKITAMLDMLRQSSVATAIYTSPALEIGFINEGMQTAFGRTVAEDKAQFPDLLPEGDQQALASLLSEIWNSAQPFQLLAYPVRLNRNGAIEFVYMDWHMQPILDSEGRIEAMIHTVKEAMNPMRATPHSYSASEESSYDEKLQKWSHVLSHDLRNPLSVAKLGMQYMQSRKQMTPEEQAKWVKMVIDALESVEKLIVDTVEISRNQVNNSYNQPSNVQRIIHQIVQNDTHLGFAKNPLEIGMLIALSVEIDVLQRIFSLTIQSVLQTVGRDTSSPILIDSVQNELVVTYTVVYTCLNPATGLVGYSILEHLMQEQGGSISVESTELTHRIFLNFPIY